MNQVLIEELLSLIFRYNGVVDKKRAELLSKKTFKFLEELNLIDWTRIDPSESFNGRFIIDDSPALSKKRGHSRGIATNE